MTEWFVTSWETAAAVAIGLTGTYVAVILATRVAGLRSFSKMSSFDFAMTVAIGTLVASTAITRDPPLLDGLVAIVTLYLLQFTIARLRVRFQRFAGLIDNSPLLLVENGVVIDENLRRVRVTQEELRAAVRAANLGSIHQVGVAVMETTGDISVVAGPRQVDPDLLRGVRR